MGQPHASAYPSSHSAGYWRSSLKRVADLACAVGLAVVLSPLMLLIAALIRLDSSGPALYVQERVGLGSRPFRMLKFRTMYLGSDDASHRQAAADWFAGVPAPAGYKMRQDPRVTRVGRFLRRTSLDELPQLFNVLRGDMSLVGPRPAIAYELEFYLEWHYERFSVRPGVTGLWQISGRDWVPAAEMMRLDCEYVRHCSAWLDFKIVALTVPSLLGLGARKKARMGRAAT
jgi:lipopolysaccharide/colanic/teichoic acid biosynthesis glycosyltransferase